MLIMRIYALYDRSRKVLVMYIAVAVLIVIGGCVSPGNTPKPHLRLLILWHLVGDAQWKKRTSELADIRRLRSNPESRKVSALA